MLMAENGKHAADMLGQLCDDDFYDEQCKGLYFLLNKVPNDFTNAWGLHVIIALKKSPLKDFGFETKEAGGSPQMFETFLGDLQQVSYRRKIADEADNLASYARSSAVKDSTIEDARLNFAFMDVKSSAKGGLSALLERQFKPDNQPQESEPVFLINGAVIATPGNIVAISAQAKAGKSAVIGAMLSAVMSKPDCDADNFGISANTSGGGAILHFDTEQAVEDHDMVLRSAMRRAGVTTLTANICSFWLKGKTASECWSSIRMACRYFAKDSGKLHSVFIDGVADLVNDVNDQKECNPLVSELEGLAVEYKCPVVTVIHQNPGTQKTRGHLGSQIERKAESNLQLEKDGDVTVVYSTKQRRAPITKDDGPRFKWDNESGMHRSCAPASEEKQRELEERSEQEVLTVFGDDPELGYGEMKKRAKEELGFKSDSTFDAHRKAWKNCMKVSNYANGMWRKTC